MEVKLRVRWLGMAVGRGRSGLVLARMVCVITIEDLHWTEEWRADLLIQAQS